MSGMIGVAGKDMAGESIYLVRSAQGLWRPF